MFQTFILTLLKVLPALPLLLGFVYGLLQAGALSDFKSYSPQSHAKLVNASNWLLWLLIEHWLGYIISCVFVSFLWTLMVAEPKKIAKNKFAETRKTRLGR